MAGYSPDYPPPGYKLYLLGSEENEPLRVIPVTNLVVMPRNLGMEMRLFKSLAANATLPDLLDMSREFLEKQAAAEEEVGPPYTYATITPAGLRRWRFKLRGRARECNSLALPRTPSQPF